MAGGQKYYITPQYGLLGNYLEPAMAMLSGAVAEPVAGLAGLLALPGGPDAAGDMVRKVRQSLTYQPRTQEGIDLSRSISESYPVQFLGQAVQYVPDAVYEMTKSPLAGAAAAAAQEGLLGLVGGRVSGVVRHPSGGLLGQPLNAAHFQRGALNTERVFGLADEVSDELRRRGLNVNVERSRNDYGRSAYISASFEDAGQTKTLPPVRVSDHGTGAARTGKYIHIQDDISPYDAADKVISEAELMRQTAKELAAAKADATRLALGMTGDRSKDFDAAMIWARSKFPGASKKTIQQKAQEKMVEAGYR